MERGAGGEVQLTDGMAKLIGHQPFHGLRYEGRRFDCGDKAGYLEAQVAFALKRPDMAPAMRSCSDTPEPTLIRRRLHRRGRQPVPCACIDGQDDPMTVFNHRFDPTVAARIRHPRHRRAAP